KLHMNITEISENGSIVHTYCYGKIDPQTDRNHSCSMYDWLYQSDLSSNSTDQYTYVSQVSIGSHLAYEIIIDIDLDGTVTCGANEYLVRCSHPIVCQPSCTDPDRVPCPTVACIRGCECTQGYIRSTDETEDNPCIPISECQNQNKSTCAMNEVESECANPCQPSCGELKREPCPTFTCSKGCICADGFV
ncbi:unnamed protein product, partial [Adineta ricciae]